MKDERRSCFLSFFVFSFFFINFFSLFFFFFFSLFFLFPFIAINRPVYSLRSFTSERYGEFILCSSTHCLPPTNRSRSRLFVSFVYATVALPDLSTVGGAGSSRNGAVCCRISQMSSPALVLIFRTAFEGMVYLLVMLYLSFF